MNEVHEWLRELGKHTGTFGKPIAKSEGSWVWADEVITAPIWVAALRRAGFKFSTKRGKFFHVSTKFLPGECAEGLHREPVPFPPGYVKRKPGPKKGSKRVKEYVLSAVSTNRDEYESRVELTNLLAAVPD
jgi:hypothetical protein